MTRPHSITRSVCKNVLDPKDGNVGAMGPLLGGIVEPYVFLEGWKFANVSIL